MRSLRREMLRNRFRWCNGPPLMSWPSERVNAGAKMRTGNVRLRVMVSSIGMALFCCCYAQRRAAAAAAAAGHGPCDNACLIEFTHRYMDALVHKDVSRIPLAPDVRFTENDVQMPIGEEGIWGTISAVSPNAMTVADSRTANAAWFGTVEEHGEPA